MSNGSRLREALKQASILAIVLIAAGFILEGFFAYPQYGIALLIAALTWLHIHVQERDETRAAVVLTAFGTSEEELRSLFGLSREQITVLLDDPKARADFAAHLERALTLLHAPARDQSLN